MRLLDVRLSDIAGLSSRHVQLHRGINLVSGGNASGKTSLVRALQSALLDRVPEGERHHRQGAPPAVAIRFEKGEGEKLVERVFGAAETVPAPLVSEDAAAAVFWLQGGMLAGTEAGIRQRVRRLSLAEDPQDAGVLLGLQDEYRRLTSHDPWGSDREEQGELEQLRGRLAEIEQAWEERLGFLRQLGMLRVELKDQTQPRVEEPAAAPVAGAPAVEAPPQPPTVHESFEDELIAPSISVGDDDWEGELDSSGPTADPAKVRERLWEVQKEAAALRQELVAVPALSMLLPAVLTVLFLVLGGALAIFQRELWLEAALAAAALAACTWGIFAVLAHNRGGDMARLRERLGHAESERESLLHELDRLDELRRYGSTDPEECAADAAPAPEPSPENSDSDVEADTSSPGADADTPRATPWQQRRQLLAELSDLRSLEMEGEALRYREQQLLHRLKVLTTAIEMLLQAEEQFSGGRRSELSEAMNRQLLRLSPGVPLTLSLGGNWLPEVHDPASGELRPLRELSRGERTLVSLAVHLVLLDSAVSTSLPLVADDLFDDFHRDWREPVLTELERFAQRHQVLLTSREPDLHTRALASGWHLISLDDAAPPPSRKPKAKPAPERSDDEQLHLL